MLEKMNYENYDIDNELKLISKEYRALLKGFTHLLDKVDKKNLRIAFEMALNAHS